MVLSDDQRAIIAELNADARHTEEALVELVDECDTFPEVIREMADADLYDPADLGPPCEWMPREESDDEFPY